MATETKNDTIEIADEDVVTRKPKRNKGFFLKKVITPALIAGGLVGAAVAALWFTPISFLSFMSVLKTGSLITNIIGGACFGFASAILATPAYFKLKKWLTNRHYKKLYGAKSNNLKKLEEGQEIEKLPIVTLLNKIKNSNLGIKRIRNRWHGVYDFKAFLDKQIAGIVDKESDTAKKYIKLQKYIQTAIDEDIIKNYNAKKEGKAKFNENLDIHVRRSIKDKHNFKTDINFTARCKDMIKKAFSNPNVEVNFEKMKEESTDVTELEKFVTPTATADKTRLDFSTYSPEKSTSTTKTEASTLTIPELMPIEKWEEDAKEAKAKESLIQKKNNQKSKSFKVDIKVTENNYMLEFITNNSQTLENYGFSEDFLEKLKSGILSQRRNNVKFKSTPTCKRVFPTDEEQELLDKIYTICNEVMISHKEIVQACENVGLSPKFNTI